MTQNTLYFTRPDGEPDQVRKIGGLWVHPAMNYAYQSCDAAMSVLRGQGLVRSGYIVLVGAPGRQQT